MKLLLMTAAILALAQDQMSKDQHHWLKYKVGTSVTMKLTMSAGDQKMEGTMKQTLTEAKDKSYTVKSSFEFAGQTNEEDEVEDIPTKVGEDTLKIGDKEYKCVKWVAKSKRGEKESTATVWLSEGIKPPLKLEIKDERGTSVVTASAVGDKVKAADKEYDCVKLEGEMNTDQGKAKTKFWMCGDVPGMAVKIDMVISGDQGDMNMVFELSQVDVK
jgi:hypothetical protein